MSRRKAPECLRTEREPSRAVPGRSSPECKWAGKAESGKRKAEMETVTDTGHTDTSPDTGIISKHFILA